MNAHPVADGRVGQGTRESAITRDADVGRVLRSSRRAEVAADALVAVRAFGHVATVEALTTAPAVPLVREIVQRSVVHAGGGVAVAHAGLAGEVRVSVTDAERFVVVQRQASLALRSRGVRENACFASYNVTDEASPSCPW